MGREKIKREAVRYLFMVVACLFYAAALDLFMVPNAIVGGGVTGVATILNILTGVGLGVFTIALNLPILLFALRSRGWEFVLRCLVTIVTLSIAVDVFAFLPGLTHNPLLAAVYGGLAQGVGIGLFCKYNVSSGGTELLGRLLSRRFPGVSIGTLIGVLDGVVVLAGAIIFKNPENVLYALVVIFLSAKVSDIIITGLARAKMCTIITDHPDEVAKTLLENSPRGVTKLNGTGMYTKVQVGMLVTVVKPHQLTQLRQLVHTVDENAFVIVSDTTEVLGNGFKDIIEKEN